ncbi:DUF4174 domain-containing protein [Agrobacterium genomosp. 13]|uniref:DUF4174 domain-containing protein n=1 Tax=Agrobacterium genomosp. 13 TaxID=1183419 RepID=UPI0009BC63FF|nr:DUF4174 domain-containing protein [Agrobacterium genomosp. 13]
MIRLLAAAIVALASSKVIAMDSLAALEWKNRVVVVFGNPEDPKLDQQIALLASQENELTDRDMFIIRVSGGEARAVYGDGDNLRLDAAAIRKDADVSDGPFQVVLLGKDGSVKLRSKRIVENIEIFDLIDSMPMRRAEKG